MAVTEVLEALGSFEITIGSDTPREVLDAIDYFGHIAIVPGRVHPATVGDGLLPAARYVGVVRSRRVDDDRRTKRVEDSVRIGGVGMAMWLGDEDDKGAIYETAVELNNATFATAINALLPASGAITAGTVHAVAGTYSGRHQYETPRKAIGYLCDTMSTTSVPVGWRVNGNGTLDAGPEANLFVTTPTCLIVKHGAGEDMTLRALPGTTGVTRDVEDYSTRVVLLAEGAGESIATGTADLSPPSPYKDIHGNTIRLTRLVSESDTATTNADTRAEVALAQFTGTRDALELSTRDYDVHGSFEVGDYVWVYDPDQGLVDTSTEVTFRGLRINPIRLRVAEAQWAVTSGHTVAYRAANGTWHDLTDYVEFESASEVRITVGDFGRALTSAGTEPVGSRPNPDTSVPGVPVFVEPFTGSAYLDSRGFTRARVILTWNAPNNVDGSTVLDGDHYEIRYAVDTDMLYPSTWAQASQITWAGMETWAQPFVAPTGQWQTMFVAWGESSAQLQDLAPGVGYDVQIRAVDKTGNLGAWSSITTFVASEDNIPPSTPAAPSVAGSRIAVQITHELGKSSGGTFNLESDLDHFEIHVDYEPTFTPSDSTLKGKVRATAGMIQAQIPVVATVQVEETSARYVRLVAVDITGNKSGPSDAASATALLIDDAHISDLTVTKVTAGTISANWLLGASIRTATTGARVELNSTGLQAYNAGGTQTVNIASADGSVNLLGQIISGTSGRRLEIMPTSTYLPELRFYANTGTNFGYINVSSTGTDANIGINGGTYDASGTTVYARTYLTSTASEVSIVRADTQERHGAYTRYSPTSFHAGFHSGGIDGGIFRARVQDAKIGWDDGTAATANYHQYESNLTRHIGRWRNYVAIDSNEGIFTGSDTVSSTSGVTYSYGATMLTSMVPIVTLRASNFGTATPTVWGVSASSTTSFTVSWNNVQNMNVSFWCYRV